MERIEGSARALLRRADFARLCVARFLSGCALQMQNVAVGWLVYDWTRSALALGPLRSTPGAGAVAMSLLLATVPIDRRVGRKLFVGVAVFGLATIVFGLSTSLPLSMACLFCAGAADTISVVVRQTLVQAETPDGMRGRVAAVNSIFIGASNELGEFESGLLAAWLGAVRAVVLGGIGTIAVAAAWTRLFPELRRRDRLVE